MPLINRFGRTRTGVSNTPRRNRLRSVVGLGALLSILGAACASAQAPPVDLRGKSGTVDPRDLKKSDPTPPKITKTEPPPPPAPPPVRTPRSVSGVRD